jgi:hypothetical protein
MMEGEMAARIRLATLHQRKTLSGDRYLEGRLGGARLLVMPNADRRRDDPLAAEWVMVVEPLPPAPNTNERARTDR